MTRRSATDVRLKLLPLALMAIVVTTAIPAELCPPNPWEWKFEAGDVGINLLLYAPLGVALRRRPWWLVLVMAALLSGAIETWQVWCCQRHPAMCDVAANAVGALLAALAVRRWRRGVPQGTGIPIGGNEVVAACGVLAAFLALGQWRGPSPAVAGWDAAYPLLLGNEATGDRGWDGAITSVALFPGWLDAGRRHTLEADGPSARRLEAELATMATRDSVRFAGGPGLVLPASAASTLAHAAQERNGFTIVARIVPSDTLQDGPARIVSFSSDPYHRNVTLAQQAGALVLRVRTPANGENGRRHDVDSKAVLSPGRPATIVAGYDGKVGRIFVDGRLAGRTNVAAAACRAPWLCNEVLPSVCALACGAVVFLVAALARARFHRKLAFAVATGIAVALLLPRLAPALSAAMAAQPGAPFAGLAGVAAMAAALAPRRP